MGQKHKAEPAGGGGAARGGLFLYGRHAVTAALANPGREKRRLYASPAARAALSREMPLPDGLPVETVGNKHLDELAGAGAAHQGLVLEARPLAGRALDELAPIEGAGGNLVVALDHITDPHNVGAILRSAAAFGARGILTTRDRAPGESGALAKAASGALERVPWVRVVNLAAGLEKLKDLGYWRLGLEAAASERLDAVDPGPDVVLVLGAEDKGLRPRTRKCCDFLARLPISEAIDSLNVSAAAAVALYALTGH